MKSAAREAFRIAQRAARVFIRIYPTLNMWVFWPRPARCLGRAGHVELLLLLGNAGQERIEGPYLRQGVYEAGCYERNAVSQQ